MLPDTSAGAKDSPRDAVIEDPWQPDWQPLPGPQEAAFESEADELLYGGAAGGGKTDLQVGLALSRHRRSIIFRREGTQLAEIIDRLDELAPDADTNLNKGRWTLPDGRFVEVGGVKHLRDWRKYQGRPHDLIEFDELTQFARSQFRKLIIWNRSTEPQIGQADPGVSQRCRVVCATNPPTTEEERWVIDEWGPWLDPEHGKPAEPGELRWYLYGEDDTILWFTREELTETDGGRLVVEIDGEEREPSSRTFIPAKLSDNPHLAETDYGKRLDRLPEELRKAFKEGDFGVGLGSDPFQVLPRAWVKAAQERWQERSPEGPMLQLGVDPARGGKDKTVLAPRYGTYVGRLIERPGPETPDGPTVGQHVIAAAEPTARVVIDVIGYGSSPYDWLRETTRLRVQAFNASERDPEATDHSGTLTFRNRRAQAYWRLRELLDPSNPHDLAEPVALPPGKELRRELCAAKWKMTTSGIQIEPKEDIKERLGRSPDRADAVVYAFAKLDKDLPAAPQSRTGRRSGLY